MAIFTYKSGALTVAFPQLPEHPIFPPPPAGGLVHPTQCIMPASGDATEIWPRKIARTAAATLKTDGTWAPFPTNAIVFSIPYGPARDQLKKLVASLTALDIDELILVPENTLHILLFMGCAPNAKEDFYRPEKFENLTMEDCNESFLAAIRSKVARSNKKHVMHCTGFSDNNPCIMLKVEGKTDLDKEGLRALRDEVAEATGLQRQHHDDDVFSIRIGYVRYNIGKGSTDRIADALRKWGQTEPPDIEVCDISFCTSQNVMQYKLLPIF